MLLARKLTYATAVFLIGWVLVTWTRTNGTAYRQQPCDIPLDQAAEVSGESPVGFTDLEISEPPQLSSAFAVQRPVLSESSSQSVKETQIEPTLHAFRFRSEDERLDTGLKEEASPAKDQANLLAKMQGLEFNLAPLGARLSVHEMTADVSPTDTLLPDAEANGTVESDIVFSPTRTESFIEDATPEPALYVTSATEEPLVVFSREKIVQQGECLSELCLEAYGFANNALVEWVSKSNPEIRNPNTILIGERILFPDLNDLEIEKLSEKEPEGS